MINTYSEADFIDSWYRSRAIKITPVLTLAAHILKNYRNNKS